MFRHKRLLVIAHRYHSFVKDQVELIAPYFDEVVVLVRYKPIAEVARFLPVSALRRHTKAESIDLTDLPPNVRVVPVSLLYLPTDAGYKRLGEQHFRAADRIIRRGGHRVRSHSCSLCLVSRLRRARLKDKLRQPRWSSPLIAMVSPTCRLGTMCGAGRSRRSSTLPTP